MPTHTAQYCAIWGQLSCAVLVHHCLDVSKHRSNAMYRINGLQESFLAGSPGNSASPLRSDVGLWARRAPCRGVVSVGVQSSARDRANAEEMSCRHRCFVIKVYQGFGNVQLALSPDLPSTIRLDGCCEIMWVGQRITSSPSCTQKRLFPSWLLFPFVDVTVPHIAQVTHGIQHATASPAATVLGSGMLCL